MYMIYSEHRESVRILLVVSLVDNWNWNFWRSRNVSFKICPLFRVINSVFRSEPSPVSRGWVNLRLLFSIPLCNGSRSVSDDRQLETNFINHWVITNTLMNNGQGNFRNSHLADTPKVTKHVSQSNDSDQWKIKPHPLINLFSDQLMESPTEQVLFLLFCLHYMTLIGIKEMFSDGRLAMILSVILKLVILVTLQKLIVIPQVHITFSLTKTWGRCL